MKLITQALLAISLFAFGAQAKVAAKKETAAVTVTEAKILVPLKGTTVTAGYGEIKNNSKKAVTLQVKSAAPFKAIELHESVEKDGHMAMNKLEKITLEAGKSLTLKPGGHHLMLFDPSKEIKVGEKITVEFDQDGSPLKLVFEVSDRSTKQDAHDHSHH